MTLPGAVEELDRRLREACDRAEDLRLTVREDAPPRVATLAVEEAGELATDVSEQLGAARRELEAAGPVHRAIDFAQQRRLEVAADIDRLAAPRRLFELADLARRRGNGWDAWLAAFVTGLEACMPALRAVDAALVRCWRELADSARVHVDAVEVGRLRIAEPEPGGGG